MDSDLIPLKCIQYEYAKRLPVVGNHKIYGNVTSSLELRKLLDEPRVVDEIMLEQMERTHNESRS